MKLFTDERYTAPLLILSFLMSVMAILIVASPKTAIVVAVVGIYLTVRRIMLNRADRRAALAYRKNTYGF